MDVECFLQCSIYGCCALVEDPESRN